MIFGGVIRLTISFIFVAGAENETAGIGFALALFGVGAAVGHVIDRLRMSSIRYGRIVFGVWEFLAIVAILAMAIIATQSFPLLLK